jgi:hypothetical protein
VLGVLFRALRARCSSSVAPMCSNRGRSARLGFEPLESRCLLSGSGFWSISEIGDQIANPAKGTAGIDLVSMAATGSASASSKPLLANDLSVVVTGRIPTDPGNWDAIVQRGGVEACFGTSAPASESELLKGQYVQAAFNFAKAGDVVTIGPGTFDFGRGGPYYLPPCLVQGLGRGVTILTSEKMIDADGVTPGQSEGVSFALQDGTILEDCTLITTPFNPGQDGGCVGFVSTTSDAHAIVVRCDIQANDWAVYNWSPGNSLLLSDSTVTSGRVCIAAEDSGVGQNFYILRCKLIGDASLSSSEGDTSDRSSGGVFGVVARGGKVQLRDCEISLQGRASTGPSWTPRTCGVTDVGGANDDPASVDQIALWNLKCHVDPNGCDPTQCFDLDLKYSYVQAQLRVTLGSGSAPDGTLSQSWWPSPSTPTTVDNGDGTGAVATSSGSAIASVNTVYAQIGGMTSWMSSGSRTSDGTVELSPSPALRPLIPTVDAQPIIASRRNLVSSSRSPLKSATGAGNGSRRSWAQSASGSQDMFTTDWLEFD